MKRIDRVGAFVGAVLGAALGALGGGLGIALGATVGLLGGLAVGRVVRNNALPDGAAPASRRRGERIDPFTIDDPWRRLVQRALSARKQFDEAVQRTPSGPIRDRLGSIGEQVADSVSEIWASAQAGHQLAAAHRRLDAPTIRRRREALGTGELAEAESATARALDAQIDAADRMSVTIEETRQRLGALEARLGEAVARAIELSAGVDQPDAFSELAGNVESITDELEALRSALSATSRIERGGTA